MIVRYPSEKRVRELFPNLEKIKFSKSDVLEYCVNEAILREKDVLELQKLTDSEREKHEYAIEVLNSLDGFVGSYEDDVLVEYLCSKGYRIVDEDGEDV